MTRAWWRAALIGQTAWLVGNLYEGVVGLPQLLAAARSRRAPGLLGPGSPVRYYAPVAPLALGATTVTMINSWRGGGNRRLVTTTAGSLGTAVLLSLYLIRTVNLPLIVSGEALADERQRQLVRRWHRINAVRLVLLSAALAAASRQEPARGA